ncbi:DUF2000 domain-containing protein [Aminobacter sp. NyZ550]|jgi:hypothetical protein|uniref:DUF2000 domain-containing protein n=1 Tax=Aminobacter TaxID=31988 RepID=UPI0021D5D418|nr:DUF2000 domain-containing protein [Aminobacter sp. NyZ550]WAX97062.1 DUF2000 domain-containing protein [Aminobacter sp. NyZ550]
MMYPTKTALILLDELAPWQKVNVSAFLTGGLMHGYPEMAGEPYKDNDDNFYLAMIREPVFVYGADSQTIRRTFERARSRGMAFSIYTRPLFVTNNDADNRASVAATPAAGLDIVGLGLHGDRKRVDKIVNGLKFLA